MDRTNVRVFAFVAGAMILVLSGRDVEAGVKINVLKDPTRRFDDGLRTGTEHVLDNDGKTTLKDGVFKAAKPRIEHTIVSGKEFPSINSLFRASLQKAYKKAESKMEYFKNIDKLHHPLVNELNPKPIPNNDDIVKNSRPIVERVKRAADSVIFFEGRPRKIKMVSLKSPDNNDFVNELNPKPIPNNGIVENLWPVMERTKRAADSVIFFQGRPVKINTALSKSLEKDCVVDGRHPLPIFIDDIVNDSLPIKKRSVEAVSDFDISFERRPTNTDIDLSKSAKTFLQSKTSNDGTFAIPAANTDKNIFNENVHRFSSLPDRNRHVRSTPEFGRLKADFGERKEGDTNLFEVIIKKPFQFMAENTTFSVRFPERGMENNCTINYVIVKNAQLVGDLEDDDVSIVSGGIGQKNVVVKIISPNIYLYSYEISIYGKCP